MRSMHESSTVPLGSRYQIGLNWHRRRPHLGPATHKLNKEDFESKTVGRITL